MIVTAGDGKSNPTHHNSATNEPHRRLIDHFVLGFMDVCGMTRLQPCRRRLLGIGRRRAGDKCSGNNK